MRKSTGQVIAFILIACIVLSCSVGVIVGIINMNRVPMPDVFEEYLAEKFWTKGDDEENKKFEEITDDFFHDAYKNNMLDLHYTVKDLSKYGFERVEADLFATSSVDFEATLEQLHGLDKSKLSRENQITYEIMDEDLTDALNSDMPPISSPFSYQSGAQTNLFTLFTEYEFFEKADVDDYIKLLSQVPEYLNYLYEYEQGRVNDGYGMSDLMLQSVLLQFKNIYTEGEESAIVVSFAERLEKLPFLSDAEKREYIQKNRDLTVKEMFPAYEEIAEKLALFLGMGGSDGAICRYEGGKDYYAYEIKAKCGFGGSVEELYNELYKYLVRIGLEMSATKSVYPVLYNNWANGEIPNPIPTAEQTLEYYSNNLTGYFPAIENTTYTVKYLSESMGKAKGSILAYYMMPQIDNYASGSITVNPTATDEEQMMNTVAHEGYPGHLYQTVYYYSKQPNPARTLFSFPGYDEGWAVYASGWADRIYYSKQSRSVYGYLNMLNMSYQYALDAMVDIMVNYFDWELSEIVNILNEIFAYYGWYAVEAGVKNLCNSVMIIPGTYLSYGVGNMMMNNLLDYAKEQEGSKFDLVDFHKFILQVGPCNFGLLAQLENEYYRIKKLDLGEEYYQEQS